MKKKLIITGFILISILLLCLIFGNDSNENNKVKYHDMCRQIDNSKINKKDFVVVLNDGSLNELIYELRDSYKNLLVYELSYDKINNDCFKQTFIDITEYEKLKKGSVPVVIGFKLGEYQGLTTVISLDFARVEDYLDGISIIEKKKVQDDITFEAYSEKIENDQYFVIAISNENVRQQIIRNMSVIFKDVDYDIFNINSEVGNTIFSDLTKRLEFERSFPLIIYFEKGKALAWGESATELHLKEFKEKLEKLD